MAFSMVALRRRVSFFKDGFLNILYDIKLIFSCSLELDMNIFFEDILIVYYSEPLHIKFKLYTMNCCPIEAYSSSAPSILPIKVVNISEGDVNHHLIDHVSIWLTLGLLLLLRASISPNNDNFEKPVSYIVNCTIVYNNILHKQYYNQNGANMLARLKIPHLPTQRIQYC